MDHCPVAGLYWRSDVNGVSRELTMVDLQSRVTITPALLETEINGEAVFLHLDLGRYFTLNPVGTEIWNRLKEGRSVGEICAELETLFDAPPGRIEQDTLDLIERLVARDLVTLG